MVKGTTWHGASFLRGLASVLLLMLAMACDERPCTPPVCDIRHRACQRDVMAATACLRQTEPRDLKVQVIAIDDYVDDQVEQASADEIKRFKQQQAALALLGLEPEVTNYKSYVKDVTDSLAAFYTSTDDRVVILDRGQSMKSISDVDLLVHEFSHALQFADDSKDIQIADTSFDSALAAAAMVEGDATWTADRALMLLVDRDPQDVDWAAIYGDWQQGVRNGVVDQPHKVRLAYSYFAYAFGAEFVRNVDRREGLDAVNRWVFQPPATTRDVMRERKTLSEAMRKFALPELADHRLIGADALGSFVASGFIDAALRDRGDDALVSWTGVVEDSLSLWQRQSDGVLSAVWRLRFSAGFDGYEISRATDALQAAEYGSGSHEVVIDPMNDRIVTLMASEDPKVVAELSDPALSYRKLAYADLETELAAPGVGLALRKEPRTMLRR